MQFNLQMIYDQSLCYLCVGAGNLCLHIIFFKSYGNQIFARQIVNNHTFVFYLVLFTQCITSFFLSETFLYIISDHAIIIQSNFFFK